MLKRFVACIIASIALISCNSNYEFAYLYEDLPFEMEQVQRPQIPVREVDLRDFGGVGDGVTLNSEACCSYRRMAKRPDHIEGQH